MLIEYGFMQEVERRAQEVISGMIAAMGYSGYDILFGNQREPERLVESGQSQSAVPPDRNQAPDQNPATARTS